VVDVETLAYDANRDHLASVRMITTASGQREQGTTYTPYGDPSTSTLIDTWDPVIPEER